MWQLFQLQLFHSSTSLLLQDTLQVMASMLNRPQSGPTVLTEVSMPIRLGQSVLTFMHMSQPSMPKVIHVLLMWVSYFFSISNNLINIQGIKESLCVSLDITSSALCSLIRETLHLPLIEYCGSVPFDINEMVIWDASNSGWMWLNPYSDESYFGDMFLKPHHAKRMEALFSLFQQIWSHPFLVWFLTRVSGRRWKRFMRLRYFLTLLLYHSCF